MVFQYFGLLPHRSVIDNVAYGLKVQGVSRENRYAKAREAIETVGLKGWEDYLPNALSGGMQQRVGIARALTTDPEILLMDEPFSGLDPLIRREMQDELIELQDKVRKTIVFVTHDLHEALKLGNRIAIMRDGKIIQVGAPEDVITDPADDYVRDFVQDASPAKVLTAGGIMEQPEALLYEWQGPKTALRTLRSLKEDHAFMVTREGKFLGLITMKRLKNLIQNNGLYLKDALEKDIATTNPEAVLEDLFPVAASADYPIAVVDETGKFIGEIQISSIFENMIQEKTGGNND
jgi:glycine betaine/proline transport system ATP-binding protein